MLKDDKKRERAAKFEETNSGRYKWLLEIKDEDGNPVGMIPSQYLVASLNQFVGTYSPMMLYNSHRPP